MREQSGYFEGAKRLRLFYEAWLPDSPPRAVLVIVHGSGEHINRYGNLVEGLVPAGFVLTGYDQRGHGRSEGQRGHIDSWSEYREDIRTFLGLAGQLARGLPMFLYGHSLGSLEVLDYILHYSDGLAGAIVSATALYPEGVAPPHLISLARVLSGVVPTFSLRLNLQGSRLSRDPQVAKAYMEDPLVHWSRSVRWGTETSKAIEDIKSHGGEIDIPVLFLHGECDPLVSAAGARRFFEEIRYPDKAIHIYPQGLHEPHTDLDYEQAISDIKSWIDRHIVPAQGSVPTQSLP